MGKYIIQSLSEVVMIGVILLVACVAYGDTVFLGDKCPQGIVVNYPPPDPVVK
jgi:hypothetical protein